VEKGAMCQVSFFVENKLLDANKQLIGAELFLRSW
jgi:hypothetical protein